MLTIDLLDPLIVIVDGRAEYLFRSLLADYKLIQVLLEGTRGDLWCANIRGFAQRTFGITWFVVASEP